MPKPSDVLVYINDDGSARELDDAEKQYVDTKFPPFDGARPYIKSHYWQRNGWGGLRGYLQRKDVPINTSMGPAPLASRPHSTPRAVADAIIELIRKRG
jgi:hypothetical protein